MDLSVESNCLMNFPISNVNYRDNDSPVKKKLLKPKPRYISNLVAMNKYKENSIVPHSLTMSIIRAVPEVN